MARLPRHNALVFYIDFAALRQAGLLQLLDGAKTVEEPEYREFVRQTSFDYKTDLDSVLGAFGSDGRYLLVKGRFDWTSLNNYTLGQAGACLNSLCRMVGSAPERKISFFPVRANLMALAVSSDEYAATAMNQPVYAVLNPIPAAPLWVWIPASILRSESAVPADARVFAGAMQQADSVVIAFVPVDGAISAHLEVQCRTPQDASGVASQLTGATGALRDAVAREKRQLGPSDLAGILTAGTFRSEGAKVSGDWPIPKAFLESVMGAQ